MKITIEDANPKQFEFIDEEVEEETNNEQRRNLGTIKKYYLNIEYEEKDDFKKRYNTKWDAEKRKWYWLGQISKIPQVLRERMYD